MAISSRVSVDQIGYRAYHSCEKILDNELIIWGGMPITHDNEEKRRMLNLFNLLRMEWSSVSTTGNPPVGPMSYQTATIGEEMFVFGGRCDGGRCVHNDLHQLNTNSKVWKSIPCINRPMSKHSCGFISYFYQGSDHLLALGGMGGKQKPTEPQPHSLYIPYYGWYRTNEVHIMNITSSPGEWILPTVTGDIPPPISAFTLQLLPNTDRPNAVLFGGVIFPEANKSHSCNDIYILSLTNDTVVSELNAVKPAHFWIVGPIVLLLNAKLSQLLHTHLMSTVVDSIVLLIRLYYFLYTFYKKNFTKMSPQPCTVWPKARERHSSTIITNYRNEDHLLILGGLGDDFNTLADCWILNIATKEWSQIDLPESVCRRKHHSISSVTMDINTQWIIVTGGDGKEIILSPIEGVNVTMIVELEYHDCQWMVRGIWNSTQKQLLLDRMKKIKHEESRDDAEGNQKYIREIQQLKEQLRQVKEEMDQQLQQKEDVIRKLTAKNNELQAQIQQNVDHIVK